MYEMYPEWGPAKNRDESYGDEMARSAVQASFDPFDSRDVAGERPDDN